MTTREPTIAATQRRVLQVLFAAQISSGAGLAAGVTVGALLAQDMLGQTSLAGVPAALFTIGSAAAAAIVGRLSERFGRRNGLAVGYGTGAAGSLGVVAAATLDNVPLLFVALFVYGAGTATNLQARYAGADLADEAHRGRAVSTVLVATTVGAVVGPNLVSVLGGLAGTVGIPRLAGPFLLAAVAYAAAGVVLWRMLRPDPLLLAKELADGAAECATSDTAEPQRVRGLNLGWHRSIGVGATIMVLTQLVMVAIMTMTPIHMQQHGHDVAAAGLVISVHVAAMFLPSPLSGLLVDRVGAYPVAAAAAIVLLSAGVTAAFAPVDSVFILALALGLLGLGWSMGLIAGTTIITDSTPLATRATTQGAVDVCIAVAGAGGGLASGVVVATASYPALALAGAAVSLAIIPALALGQRSAPAPTSTKG
ncbi:putative MFS-type transporter YdeG [Mycobacterium antarcticum]|uniref:MFS transporter n=1 Tax=Mycolicibacterium sp. TUM20985 TaxID=3023370 RepID=UPI00257307D6|nr:MFS transporter [Mycolicibacterium sp. TUM20985]BDX31583.1 putative MFS-type transporter YdeG [Mycolicibacterium sp. TUM20985]